LNQAILALEDGTVFEGKSFGARKDKLGEVVFNTAITGYQEIFTDPSYSGQIVVLTNPQIGNYGANRADLEAARPYIEGLIVREFSSIASNWRSEENADQFLAESGVPVAAEIDTRALVRLTWWPTISESSAIFCAAWCRWAARVTVVPALTSAEDVLALKPDGVFLSNGPGDPEPLQYQAQQVRKLIGKKPDLRHLPGPPDSRARAGRQNLQAEVRASRRESSGHESGDAKSGDHLAQSRIRGGSGFAQPNEVEITHINLNDQTLEASGIAASRCSACSIIRRPRRGRTIRTTCSTTS
jgi:carbamoylphosphate synthase small subunit